MKTIKLPKSKSIVSTADQMKIDISLNFLVDDIKLYSDGQNMIFPFDEINQIRRSLNNPKTKINKEYIDFVDNTITKAIKEIKTWMRIDYGKPLIGTDYATKLKQHKEVKKETIDILKSYLQKDKVR